MENTEKKIYILGSCRTPIGKFGGSLSTVSAVDLGAIVIREALSRAGISPSGADHVIMGCVIQAGTGQNPARQAAIKAGLPVSSTAETINAVCGSGLDAVNLAARMIRTGDADIVVAGGMESMSNAPYILDGARFGYRMGNNAIRDCMIGDALWDSFGDVHMGVTAENICDKWKITREDLDAFAAESQQKAERAAAEGRFTDEIVSVEVKQKKETILFSADESIRPGTTAETLAKLKPAFIKVGRVTAGNSSGINDGAAAVVLVSEEKRKELGLIPEAEWIGGTLAGVDPSIMGIGPVASTRKLFGKLGMTMDDVDLIEANEAFAAQSIAVAKELGFPKEKLNVNGGAIALGHPVGASGCRILVTLIHEMKKRGSRTGLATLCVGGGMGCSTVVGNPTLQ